MSKRLLGTVVLLVVLAGLMVCCFCQPVRSWIADIPQKVVALFSDKQAQPAQPTEPTDPSEPTEGAPAAEHPFVQLFNELTTDGAWNVAPEGATIFDFTADQFAVETEEQQGEMVNVTLRVNPYGAMTIAQKGYEPKENHAGEAVAPKFALCECELAHSDSWGTDFGQFHWVIAEGNCALGAESWTRMRGELQEVELSFEEREIIRNVACYWFEEDQDGKQVLRFGIRVCGEQKDPEAPKPVEPKPTEPKPVEPKPTEPKPTEPEPTEPEPTEPKPTEPEPTEPPRDPLTLAPTNKPEHDPGNAHSPELGTEETHPVADNQDELNGLGQRTDVVESTEPQPTEPGGSRPPLTLRNSEGKSEESSSDSARTVTEEKGAMPSLAQHSAVEAEPKTESLTLTLAPVAAEETVPAVTEAYEEAEAAAEPKTESLTLTLAPVVAEETVSTVDSADDEGLQEPLTLEVPIDDSVVADEETQNELDAMFGGRE